MLLRQAAAQTSAFVDAQCMGRIIVRHSLYSNSAWECTYLKRPKLSFRYPGEVRKVVKFRATALGMNMTLASSNERTIGFSVTEIG